MGADEFIENMAGDIILEDEEENILYDLLINTEWPPETDTQVCQNIRAFFNQMIICTRY